VPNLNALSVFIGAPQSSALARRALNLFVTIATFAALFLGVPVLSLAQGESTAPSGEAHLVLPDLRQATFFNGAIDGRSLLLYSLRRGRKHEKFRPAHASRPWCAGG
jgi:hypothetical protein